MSEQANRLEFIEASRAQSLLVKAPVKVRLVNPARGSHETFEYLRGTLQEYSLYVPSEKQGS